MDPYCWGAAWVLMMFLVMPFCRGQTEEDEKRPYKFAFAIEGYQHRSEEKDEKGIIMGEFGFVTGDGVYHVTVYATDENGDFKILKMKNYYIGLPGEGTTVAPTRAPPLTTARPQPPTLSTTKSPILKHLEGLMGCSGCIVPDKNNGQPGVSGARGTGSTDGKGSIDIRVGGTPDNSLRPPFPDSGPEKQIFGGGKPSYNIKEGNKVQSELPNAPGSTGSVGGQPGFGPLGSSGQPFSGPGSNSGGGVGNLASDRFGSQPPASSGGSPPTSGLGTTGSTGSVQGAKPGSPQSSPGLPPGMTMQDLMALLYKFNYTLKYHGHHESGYRNGDKEGGYFFNGQDGMGRNVKYIANEFGFQPNITLVDLGLQNPDTPKEQNEEPNELRGYEFKWFY